jgi:hypothetical protein
MTVLRILLPCLSIAIGAGSTLLIAAAYTQKDPAIAAAEHRFLELPPGEARRIKATYDRLSDSPTERTHVTSIHRAVTGDAVLESRLQRVYDWWLACDEEQRQDLRELAATPQRWVTEVERQFADANENSVTIVVPDRLQRGRRPQQLQVSLQQVDRFLEDALPSEETAVDDLLWLKSVLPEDLRLARVVVVTKSLFSAVGRPEGPRPNQEAVNRVVGAAAEHILTADHSGFDRNPRQMAFVCFAILRAIKDRLAPEFVERLEISTGDLEEQFAELNMSEQIGYMLTDPQEAAGLLNARMKALEQDTPAAELAGRLVAIDRAENRIRGMMRGGPRGGGWWGDRGGREGERRPDGRRGGRPPGSVR